MSMAKIIEDIEKELNREKKLENFLGQRKRMMPAGSLSIRDRKRGNIFFQKNYSKERSESILLDPNNDEDLRTIKLLMEKRTVLHGLPVLRGNIDAMEKFLTKVKSYNPCNFKFGEMLSSEYYLDDDVCLKEWLAKEDCQNPWYQENRKHETKSGKMVRSKSEVIIADSLFDNELMFKYEPKIVICGKILYPDFEIMHPVFKTLFWWEHLGMIDDPEYVIRNIEKFEYYRKAGIYPGVNLIVTYETADRPLTHGMIDDRLMEFGFFC